MAPGAELLAQITRADGNDCAVVFAIEKGAELANGNSAPNRVVGFSLPGLSGGIPAETMTDEAWAFFDAAIAWLNPAPVEMVDPGTDGLVAYYAMDGDVTDGTGNGNDGVIMGAEQGRGWNLHVA